VFLAHTAEARSTLDTFVVVDPGAMDRRVDVDGAHRANGNAISASHAFLRIDLHGAQYNTTRRLALKQPDREIGTKGTLKNDLLESLRRQAGNLTNA
jgi:hypothetical protein